MLDPMTTPALATTANAPLNGARENSRTGLWISAILLLAVLLVYAPVLADAASIWLNDEKQGHGIFILPLSALLIYLRRGEFKRAISEDRPHALGLFLLGFGLLIETGGYLLRLKVFPMLSLAPTVAGVTLLLWGPRVFRLAAFPILFLIFAVPMPDALTLPLSAHVQRVSTNVAANVLVTTGIPIAQSGNRLETPTLSVEVAEVCSGFKKLTSLFALSWLFGYFFPIGLWRRLLLVIATYPIALAANVARVCALVAIGNAWGPDALKQAHDPAEASVLVVALGLFLLFGQIIGCRKVRFTL